MNFKFRIWHIPSKKFVEKRQFFNTVTKTYFNDGFLYISCDGELVFEDCEDGYVGYIQEQKRYEEESILSDYIIQRYTGMKDSCGVEVYEGDIVQKDNHTAEVFWNDTIGGFDLSWRENKYIHDEHSYVFNFRNLLIMKVIGHINEI